MLLELPENCIFGIFEYCEVLGAAMYLALCNHYLYNFAFGRIDLRYRESYIMRHDKLAAQLLTYNKCKLRNDRFFRCQCEFSNCKEGMWSKLVVKWCREENVEALSHISLDSISYGLLFQFPTTVLASHGRYIIDTFSYEVMQYGSVDQKRKYLAVCYRLGIKSLKQTIKRHKFHTDDKYIDDELCNYIVGHFTGFSLATFARSTLIDKHDHLKKVANYCPEYECAFDDIDVVEKHLHKDSIREKLLMFIAMQRIDCILLCLRMEPECSYFTFVVEFLAHSQNRKIMKILPSIKNIRSVIHECIMTNTYHNYEFWRDQDINLTPQEIHNARNSVSVPRAIAAKISRDENLDFSILKRGDYDVFIDKIDISDPDTRIMWLERLTTFEAYRIIDRIIEQYGVSYTTIYKSFSLNNSKLNWMVNFVKTYSPEPREDLGKVLYCAITTQNHEMFDRILPMVDITDAIASTIIFYENWRAFRKTRLLYDKWEKYISKYCREKRRKPCCVFHHYTV